MMRRQRGQAMVELALGAPFLVLLLLGGSQVGALAYGQISVDTAAREGVRAGVEAPDKSLAFSGGVVPGPAHTCSTSDFSAGAGGNPICLAVLNADGFLSPALFTTNPCTTGQACVTISVDARLQRAIRGSAPARLLSSGSPCNNGSAATVSGTVAGVPVGSVATVTDTTGDSVQSNSSGGFTMCVQASATTSSQTLTARVGSGCTSYSGSVGPFAVTPGSSYTENLAVVADFATVQGQVTNVPAGQTATVSDDTGDSVSGVTRTYSLCVATNGARTVDTVTAQVGSAGCGGWSGSQGPFSVSGGGSYTENLDVAAEPACPPPTPTPVPTPTPTPGSGPPTVTCQATPDYENDYITVTVSYPAPIFVPLVGQTFTSAGQTGTRVLTATVTLAVEPCSLTGGA